MWVLGLVVVVDLAGLLARIHPKAGYLSVEAGYRVLAQIFLVVYSKYSIQSAEFQHGWHLGMEGIPVIS